MAWEKNWIKFEDVRYIKTSASGKAILVEIFGEDTWLPCSQMEDGGSDGEIAEIEQSGRLVISEWIAGEKDLITKQEEFEKEKKAAEEAEKSSKLPEDDIIDGVFGPKPPDPVSPDPWANGEYVSADTSEKEIEEVFGPAPTKTKTNTETHMEEEMETTMSAWGESLRLSKELREKKEKKPEKKLEKESKKESKSKNKTVSLWGEAEETMAKEE